MSAILLWIIVATSTYLPPLPLDFPQQKKAVTADIQLISEVVPVLVAERSVQDIEQMLRNTAPMLNQQVMNKVLMTLKCASQYNVDHHNVLTVIDYSLPSN